MKYEFDIKSSNTIIYCKKWKETVDFYKSILKLDITVEKNWFVEFQLAQNSTLSIADEKKSSIKSARGRGITMALEVEDAIEVWECFKNRDANICEPLKIHPWGAYVFYLKDPEGNRIEIWSKK